MTIELGLSGVQLYGEMPTQTPILSAAAQGTTEKLDPVACLDERVRRVATPSRPTAPGRYIEVQGQSGTLLIGLAGGVTHIGRGLAADLRLDDVSVSRRHAILVEHRSGVRVLDDRSSNGTFVNGRRVLQAELESGDMLGLGRVVLRYLEV